MGKDSVPILLHEIDREIRNADLVAHFDDIFEIMRRHASSVRIIFFPVFHEKANHFMTLFLQKKGGHRGIDSTRHTDNKFFSHYEPISIILSRTFRQFSASFSLSRSAMCLLTLSSLD